MSERNWTAGPWTVSPGRDAQEWSIDALDGDEDLNHISWSGLAVVYGSDDYPKKGAIKAKANAHLIAASPRMYEALAAVLDDNHACGHTVPETLDMVEQVMSKARGEQP